MRSIDKFRGCLIGGAAGDALGYAVEFLRESQIFSRYGGNGITEYALKNGVAEISDDTQMTLFTANGLLLGTTRGMTRGVGGCSPYYVGLCYKDWYRTQMEEYPVGDRDYCSWLLNIPELFSRRAPGMTCLSAIEEGANGTLENPINQSKGCGGVMRVAPIGLYFCGKKADNDFVDMFGAEVAAITHGHELGYIPAAALVHIIKAVSENENISLKEAVIESVSAMQRLFSNAHHIEDFTELMKKAITLAFSDADDLSAIHQLGEGWVAEETLAIAVFCTLRYENDFDKALTVSVNHNGDSDSTGAVAGNILGACIGYNAIPQKYKQDLELHDLIFEVADDLYNDCKIGEYIPYEDEVWESKYIHMTYPNGYIRAITH